MAERTILKDLAGLFLKLGFTAFGGPAAHIAMMQREVVQKRKWIDDQHFLDLLGATNLIPGPNSTELAIHIGREKAGWKGLLVAGLCFILPAVGITLIFAWLYSKYGNLPSVAPFVYGIKPAIIAIILAAVIPLARKSVKSFMLGFIGIIALLLALTGITEIYVMFGAGLFALILKLVFSKRDRSLNVLLPFPLIKIVSSTIGSVSNLKLFWIFLKVGSILYGSGYVLFAFLDTELVETGIISRQQLVDAIAVGQFTPGPVFSSVTFIGYQINGLGGAAVATVGIFLPAFLFVALLNPLVRKMRNSTLLSSFLDAVNVASVAVIAAVCYEIGKESITDWRTSFIAISSMTLLLIFKELNSAWIVIGGSLAGYILSLV